LRLVSSTVNLAGSLSLEKSPVKQVSVLRVQKEFPQAVKDLGFMRADTADKNRRHWRKDRWIAKGYYKIPCTCGKTVTCILDVSEEDRLKGKVE